MDIPDNIINKTLYKKAKKKADETYKRPSAYKSMFIQKVYKEMGGKYKGKKTSKASTSRWLKEEWIQLIPYLKDGKKIACGEDNKKTKVCRPSKRVDKKTPITIQELQKKYDKKTLLKLARQKNRDMSGIILWKKSKFIPSKK